MADRVDEILEDLKRGRPLDEALGFTAQAMDHIAALGVDSYQRGRLEAARRIFAGLAHLRPERADYWSALGAVLTRLERHAEAIPVLTLALRLQPDDTSALVNRGQCYMALGEVEKAGADFARAVELDPRAKAPASNRARLLISGFARFFERVHQEGLDRVEWEEA